MTLERLFFAFNVSLGFAAWLAKNFKCLMFNL